MWPFVTFRKVELDENNSSTTGGRSVGSHKPVTIQVVTYVTDTVRERELRSIDFTRSLLTCLLT